MFDVYHFFESNAVNYPDKEAVVKGDMRYTYSDLQIRVNCLSDSMVKCGLKRGDRIGILFRNGIEFVEVFYAVRKIGGVCIPIATLCMEDELLNNLKSVECDALFYGPEFDEMICKISGSLEKKPLFVTSADKSEIGKTLESMISEGDAQFQTSVYPGEDEDALFLFTSGSTGKAKCVVHSCQNLQMFVTLPFVCNATFFPDDIMLYYAPLFHLAGVTYMLYLLSVGGTLVLVDRFDPAQILHLFEKEKITQTFLIPPVLARKLYDQQEVSKNDLSSLRYIIMSGGGNAETSARLVYEMFPNAVICNTYGMSERAANTILFMTREEFEAHPERITSVGKVTQFGRLKLLNEEGGEDDFGEAYASCPGMLKGYLHSEAPIADGFFATGDILRRDSEGYYYFIDRRKDMIKTGGENVFSFEVESVLNQHPAIASCAVVGLPDERFQEAVSAAVILKKGMSVTKEELQVFAVERMASYKKPRNIFFLEDFPMTASGKISKIELRRQLLLMMQKN